MIPTVTQREAARRDLVGHFVYLAENAGLDMAERFLSNAEASFSELAQQPKIGAPLTLTHPTLANVRKWRVKGFDNHLISAGIVTACALMHCKEPQKPPVTTPEVHHPISWPPLSWPPGDNYLGPVGGGEVLVSVVDVDVGVVGLLRGIAGERSELCLKQLRRALDHAEQADVAG